LLGGTRQTVLCLRDTVEVEAPPDMKEEGDGLRALFSELPVDG